MVTVAKKPSEAYLTIPDVNYRGEIQTWNIFRKMTSEMDISQLSELYETEKPKGNPHPASSDLIYSIFLGGFNLREKSPNEAQDLREFFKTGLGRYPNTLSIVEYNPFFGEDKAIHNYKTSEEYELKGNIAGPDGLVKNLPDANFLEMILGTKNTGEINDVFKWINSTDSYVYRLNIKPSKKTEKVVGFLAGAGGVGLFCNWIPPGGGPAFRVARVE